MPGTIISASRRTDIPAFHSAWFVDRLRAGSCQVINPFNPKQVTEVTLKPDDVAAIVFWTRNARPLLEYLDEIDRLGYPYYFQYTITGYPRLLEPRVPEAAEAITTVRELAGRIGSSRVIWRYDPILVSNVTSFDFHAENFARLASSLNGCVRRVVISLFDPYRAAVTRLNALRPHGLEMTDRPENLPQFGPLMRKMVADADFNGMEIVSCSEEVDLARFGVVAGKCVDDGLVRRVFGIEVPRAKDSSQRKRCLCAVSKDIGTYNTCFHGCRYCYATRGTSINEEN